MPRASNTSSNTAASANSTSSGSSPLGPFPKTTVPPVLPLLPLDNKALASSSFAAPSTSSSSSSTSASSTSAASSIAASASSSSPLAPTLPPLPLTDADAAERALAELQDEEKAEGTGRMWDRAETDRLHKEFQTYWDGNKKHERLGTEFHRSWRSIQCKWYEWAKVHLAEEKEARKQKEPKGEKPMATRMWTQKDTERLHLMFKQEWDKTGKGPKSKWHAYTALLFKRSKRAIQGKWYEWAKVAGIGLRAWPKIDGEGRISGPMLSDSSDDSEGEFPMLPPADDAAASPDGVEKKEGDEQPGAEKKEGETAMTDVPALPASSSSKSTADSDKQTERLARKRRREERRSAGANTAAAAINSSTLDTLRLSPADFQHILELRVGGINFGTLLVSSGDQPAAVQLVYKEGQTVTWNNPAFPQPAPPASSSSSSTTSASPSSSSTSVASSSGASPAILSAASPPAVGSLAAKLD